ncbi:MAG TPA: prolyl oligopeptidase family serine peptidase [Rhodanobacteraceae bacterium]
MSIHFTRTLGALSLVLASILVTESAMASTTTTPQAQAITAAELPVSTFARHATLGAPRLSPDGKHLLVRVDDASGREHTLVVYDLSNMHIVSQLRMPIYELPLDPEWAGNDWIVLEIGKHMGSLDKPVNTGQVISTRIDGKRQHYLYGWNNQGGDLRTQSHGSDEGLGYIVGLPQVPNNHVYVRTEPFGHDNQSIIYDINAENGVRHQLAQMSVAGMSFLVAPDGHAAYAFGNNADFDYVAYRQIDNRWQRLSPKKVGDYFAPLAYTPDHQHIYAMVNPDGGPTQLVREALDGSGRIVLASNQQASVGDIQWTAPPLRPFAVIPEAGIPQPVFLDPNAKDSKLYRALAKTFAPKVVDFINFDQDGGKLLFFVSSDRDPGTYYLIDTHTFKVRKLFAVAPWINPGQMAARQPFQFKASDGTELDGILTFPLHRAHKNLPMVLVPHGGPYGIRDSWDFDEDAQFLANRGYLVLQVNYRGSGGRGVKFENAGFGKWGTRIQQDLIDGVKWAIAQHYANPGRICVYGGSFGGYSALMTVIRAPHLFKCAIGYAGVYDLPMMFKEGNIQSTQSGKSYLAAVLGTDPAVLDANSPDKLADKIDVPVFLVHGKDDHQAPYDGALAMRKALKAAGKPFQWLAINGEGHGFYTEAHRVELLTQMQAFLAKYIGPGAPPAKH